MGPKLVFFHPIHFKKLNWILFFFFIQTGPNTPLYATTYVPVFFSPLCFRFLFVELRGGATKKKGRMTKRGTPPQTLTKRGTLLFASGEVFDIHVVVGINPTAQHDVCASTYTILHIFSITVSEQPNAQRPVVQALSSPKRQTHVWVNMSVYRERTFYPRRAS